VQDENNGGFTLKEAGAERKLGEMLTAAKAAGQITRGNKTGSNQHKSGNVFSGNNSSFTIEQAQTDPRLELEREPNYSALPGCW